MGGRGGGRVAIYAGKATTEESLPLDIRRLKRAGVLTPGRAFGWQWTSNDRVRASVQIRTEPWQIELQYRYTPHGRSPEFIRQTVALETTPCTLGGSRQWFACPRCSKRVAVLYGTGRLFACRKCKCLAYASQREAGDDRAARRADRIRKRLGWPAGFLNGPGGKPKFMRWSTFARLVAEHDALISVTLEGMARRLGIVDRLLGDARAHLDSRP